MLFLKLMAYIVLCVIAIDTFYGGIFAGYAGRVLGVVVAGYSMIQAMIEVMGQRNRCPKESDPST